MTSLMESHAVSSVVYFILYVYASFIMRIDMFAKASKFRAEHRSARRNAHMPVPFSSSAMLIMTHCL